MAWKPIIVGVDGTPESLRAAALAARIANTARAQLIPVHAVPVIPAFTGVTGIEPVVFSPELQNELMRSSRAQITRALEQVLPPAAVARLDVQTGPAPFILAEAAHQWQAELVVLGGKQHGALARGLGRSTAHYLVRKLDVPVLVVGDSPAPITRVLAAVDLSPTSAPTVAAAERLAGLFGARLRLLHVIEPLRFTEVAPDQWDELGYERRSEELFDRFVTPFKDVPKEDRVVRRGIPAEMIAGEAGAWHANMVVAGSHGKGWVDRILVGSTTERLVTELPTSILVVPSGAIGKATAEPAQR
ncbi:MAG TPA: universal stress protein, partial [Gaiellales bacterium]|nr:universal stress protein [Gaiellales bacterium]